MKVIAAVTFAGTYGELQAVSASHLVWEPAVMSGGRGKLKREGNFTNLPHIQHLKIVKPEDVYLVRLGSFSVWV